MIFSGRLPVNYSRLKSRAWNNEDAEPGEEAPDLPQEITVTDRFRVNDYLLSDGGINQDALKNDVTDWLSDEYGFLHSGYRMRISLLKPKNSSSM